MDTNIIDLIALDEGKKTLNLIIMDNISWIDPKEHIDLIQQKILFYEQYIDQQLFKEYPSYSQYPIVIQVIFEFQPSEEGLLFIQEAQSVLDDVGYHLSFINYDDIK